jgi:hypothetical protein
MAKYFDADGNEVEAFSKEDVEKIKQEAVAGVKAPDLPFKPEDFETVRTTLGRVTAQLTEMRVGEYAKVYAGNDPEKVKAYKDSFGRITGYADDDAGFEARAKDAARLAFGTDAAVSVDTSGAGRNVDTSKPAERSAEDKVIQSALGISEEDAKKYGGEQK